MAALGLSGLLLLLSVTQLANGGIPGGNANAHVRYPRGVLRARDTTYSTSNRDPTTNAQFGTTGQLTTVNAGVTRWLSGLGTHNFYGNLNNYGQIIISQTDFLSRASAGGQTSDFVGHTTTNGNLLTGAGSIISLNDYGSASAPTYDWYLRTFTNNGAMQWCGRGDTGGSTYQLYCDIDCYNYGVIDFEQYYGRLGAAFVWRNANLYPPGATTVYNTYNYGAFRIVNVTYHNVQNVLGNGCYVIGYGGTLYLEDGSGYYQNVNFGPTFPDQSIYMTDPTATIHMDTQVYSHNSNFGPQVYGFTQGNAIEFYEVFPTSNVFTYTASTGVLTVRLNSGNSVNIKLGTGYDPSLFYTARNPTYYNTAGYNAIFYRGTAPGQTAPAVCGVSVGTCGDPAATAGPYASSTSATGYVTTTAAYTGAGTITGPQTTTIPPSGTQLGTVEVFTPAAYATSTSASNGLAAAYTTTVPQVGTTPGTVVIVTPASYVTVTSTGNVNGAYTSTAAQASGTAPGTVVVITPAAYATSTSASNGLAAAFTTTIPASGTAPGTIVVVTPASYVTSTSAGNVNSAYTSTIAQASGTAPGTVVVVTPAPTASSTATRPSVISTTIGPNQCVCRPRT